MAEVNLLADIVNSTPLILLCDYSGFGSGDFQKNIFFKKRFGSFAVLLKQFNRNAGRSTSWIEALEA